MEDKDFSVTFLQPYYRIILLEDVDEVDFPIKSVVISQSPLEDSESLVVSFKETGPQGIQGIQGERGIQGIDGKSAYEVAVFNGFLGEEQEWLASLKGEVGAVGSTGVAGANGKSAYEIAVDGGFVGTEEEWLMSLVGIAGAQGIQGIQGEAGNVISSVGISIDGTGSILTTGYKGFVVVPYSCVIEAVFLLADTVGSIEMDVIKDAHTVYNPTTSPSIVGNSPPQINNQDRYKDVILEGWDTQITEDTVLGFIVVSVSGIKKITLSLKVRKI